jgi:hypothetical protein
MTSGNRANTSGSLLERTVESTIRGWNKDILIRTRQEYLPPYPFGLYKHVAYATVYGGVGKTEFVLSIPPRRVRIECKWQAVSGSVDEKFPYMFLNMQRVDEPEVIFLLDGGGAKPAAVAWVKSQCREQNTSGRRPHMACMNIGEFCCWVQYGCKEIQ